MLFGFLNLYNQRSSAMVSTCFSILRNNKKLLIFPLISLIFCAIATASFILPAFYSFDLITHSQIGNSHGGLVFSLFAILFIFYLVVYFIMNFFNAAFLFCVDRIIKKQSFSLFDGIKAAASRLHVIFAWSVVAATVGILLSMIEKKGDRSVSFIRSVLGISWSIITFLALPVLIFENKGPFAAIKDSIKSVKSKWGDGIRLGLRLYVYFFIPHFLSALLLAYGFHHHITALMVIGGIGIFACLFLYSAVNKIAEVIFYQYLKNGELPNGCSTQEIDSMVK